MSMLISANTNTTAAPLPAAAELRTPVRVRPATMADLPFIDGLQKMHARQVGFLHRATMG